MGLYLARHAQTSSNVQGIVQGHSNGACVTDVGLGQMDALGRVLTGVSFEGVYSSDLERCRASVRRLLPFLSFNGKVVFSDQLRGRNQGSRTGAPIHALDYAALGGDGETPAQIRDRVCAFIDSVSFGKTGNVLILGHRTTVRAYLGRVLNLDPSETLRPDQTSIQMDNGHCVFVDFLPHPIVHLLI